MTVRVTVPTTLLHRLVVVTALNSVSILRRGGFANFHRYQGTVNASSCHSSLPPLARIVRSLILYTSICYQGHVVGSRSFHISWWHADGKSALFLPTKGRRTTLTRLYVMALQWARGVIVCTNWPHSVLGLLLNNVQTARHSIIHCNIKGGRQYLTGCHRTTAPTVRLWLHREGVVGTGVPLTSIRVALGRQRRNAFTKADQPTSARRLAKFRNRVSIFRHEVIDLQVHRLIGVCVRFTAPFQRKFTAVIRRQHFHRRHTGATMYDAAAFRGIGRPYRHRR